MIFGNWADLLIGMWGVIDVLVDPYTQGAQGIIRVVCRGEVDVALRHAESFAAITDMVTA
jgi:hypothetical protein